MSTANAVSTTTRLRMPRLDFRLAFAGDRQVITAQAIGRRGAIAMGFAMAFAETVEVWPSTVRAVKHETQSALDYLPTTRHRERTATYAGSACHSASSQFLPLKWTLPPHVNLAGITRRLIDYGVSDGTILVASPVI